MLNNYDIEELDKFSLLGEEWWNQDGELKTLHHINPTRFNYIKTKTTLSHKKIIDIGCGGGILTESLAEAGAIVTGVDANASLIEIAKSHQHKKALSIEYIHTTAEAIAKKNPSEFDIVTCLELLEHVPNPASLIEAIASLAKPNASIFFSTINRNPKAYLHAILGAEYLLKILPKNTHDYAKFIRPSELARWLAQCGLETKEIKGLKYNPFSTHCELTDDPSVNYLLYAVKS